VIDASVVVEVTIAAMDTVFTLQLGGDEASSESLTRRGREALELVRDVERTCSRFDARSELAALSSRYDTPTVVSPLLFELLSLAVALAEASDGAFDPTVGRAVAALGFTREWTSQLPRPLPPPVGGSWRDVVLDATTRTVTLTAPVHLDLGALAKGFAADLVVQALADAPHCSVNAGGDVRCHGTHPDGRPWRVGIRDPQVPTALIAVAELRSGAVCSSGSYERHVGDRTQHHLIDPQTGTSARGYVSVSVAAPTAVIADGLATAAFVMGPSAAPQWLEAQGADALLIREDGHLTTISTAGYARWSFP
jgi:thiamine biosynthesis lipoprotein